MLSFYYINSMGVLVSLLFCRTMNIFTQFFKIDSYKNRQLLLHQNTENQEWQCFPSQTVFLGAQRGTSPQTLCMSTIHLLTPSSQLLIFSFSAQDPAPVWAQGDTRVGNAAARMKSQARVGARVPGLPRWRPSLQSFMFLPSKSGICIATLSSTLHPPKSEEKPPTNNYPFTN